MLVRASTLNSHSILIRGLGTFINFEEKIPDLLTERPLFYSVLLMPARLFRPVLLFGTLEYFNNL